MGRVRFPWTKNFGDNVSFIVVGWSLMYGATCMLCESQQTKPMVTQNQTFAVTKPNLG